MCLSILGVICYHLCLRGIHIGRLNVGYAGTGCLHVAERIWHCQVACPQFHKTILYT